jgi:hypothetical protein
MSHNRLKPDDFGDSKPDNYGPSRDATDDELIKFSTVTPMRTIKMGAIAAVTKQMKLKTKPGICKQSKTCRREDEMYDAVQVDFNDGTAIRILFTDDETDSFLFDTDPAESEDIRAFMTMYVAEVFKLQKAVYGEDFIQQVENAEEPAVRFDKISLDTGESVEGFGMSYDEVIELSDQAKEKLNNDGNG